MKRTQRRWSYRSWKLYDLQCEYCTLSSGETVQCSLKSLAKDFWFPTSKLCQDSGSLASLHSISITTHTFDPGSGVLIQKSDGRRKQNIMFFLIFFGWNLTFLSNTRDLFITWCSQLYQLSGIQLILHWGQWKSFVCGKSQETTHFCTAIAWIQWLKYY